MARLGNKAALVATIGADATGKFLLDYINEHKVETIALAMVPVPTTLIFVQRKFSKMPYCAMMVA